jgi:hypothetical protein
MCWVFLLQTVVHIPNVLPKPNEDCYIIILFCYKDVLEMLQYFSQLLEMTFFFLQATHNIIAFVRIMLQ